MPNSRKPKGDINKGVFSAARASRHAPLDMVAIRKRRKRNKAAAKQRRINRSKGK